MEKRLELYGMFSLFIRLQAILDLPCRSVLDTLNLVFGMNMLYCYIRELLGDTEAGSRVIWYALYSSV
jgi:hypothetical protein